MITWQEARYAKQPDSFFNIFYFLHMMHDAVDYALTYEGCVICKDIPELGLKAGQSFETIYFDLKNASFEFINWKGELGPDDHKLIPDESFLVIKQDKLAPYLKW